MTSIEVLIMCDPNLVIRKSLMKLDTLFHCQIQTERYRQDKIIKKLGNFVRKQKKTSKDRENIFGLKTERY